MQSNRAEAVAAISHRTLKLFIMSRVNHSNSNETKSQNPTKKYLSWKSVTKNFSYYDKEAEEDVVVDIPLKFVFLQHYHTVKGWHDASASGIYSNEVYYIGSEQLNVRSFKGGEIASGLYKEIKPSVLSAGGKYHRSIYVMLEDGTIANISIKGAAVKEWSDFFDANKNLLDNNWVEINESADKKKGSIKYSTPVFTIGKALSKAESTNADNAAAEFQTYINNYFSKDIEVNEPEVVTADELDF